jgi:hypothetical protein
MFSLQTLDLKKSAEQGFDMKLRNPVDNSVLSAKNDKGVLVTPTISILGVNSATVQAHDKAQNDKTYARLQFNPRNTSKKKDEPITSDELEKNNIARAVACTVSWENISLDGKTELTFSEENARELYTKFAWIREQVLADAEDLENFL